MAHYRSPGARDLVITCIKGDGSFLKFWALPANALETLKKFESWFSQIADDLEAAPGFIRSDQIPIGLKCAVKSKIKQMWCRARVLIHDRFGNVSVQLMDYGNEEMLHISDLRDVEDKFFTTAPQAVECILADVIPARANEWLPEAIHFCEQQLLFNKLSCYVVSEYMKIPVVRVAIKGEAEPFVQRLINRGLALIKLERPSYKVNNMDQNTSHLVKVSWVESTQKFYVQLSAAEVELNRLMDSLKCISDENLSLLKSSAVNTPCLAKLATKPYYFRAIVTYVQQSRCKVFFVDYGYLELKEIQELRAIPPSFLNLPAQAICCSLPRDVKLDTNLFRQLINLHHLECHILSRTPESYIVKLLKNGQDIVFTSQTYIQQNLNVGSTCDVTISYTNDITEFYIQLTQFKEQLNTISSILNSNYNFPSISLSECTPQKPVCVKYSEDNLWYRAQIMKVNNENDIEVFFVDFGNYDNISLCDVRKITPDLLKFPIQAFKSYLFETAVPLDFKNKDTIFDLFEELTSDQVLTAYIQACTEESTYGIQLFPKNSKISINETLISSLISVPIISISEIECLYVTSFSSPVSFFSQLEKLDFAMLTEMQEEINTFYSGSPNMSYIPKKGDFVCARFQVDNRYYRAKVEKLLGNNLQCEVFFLDYGNKEIIPISDLHFMNVKFTKFPQFGVKCAFENYPAEISNDEIYPLIFENSIQANMIRQENDIWYIALTENFPSNLRVLSLFKQHENPAPRSIHGAGLGGYQEKIFVSSNSENKSVCNENSVPHFISRNETVGSQSVKDGHHRAEEFSLFSNANKSKLEEAEADYTSIAIPPQAYRNIYISHVISPSEFYCQIEEDSSKLQVLMKNVEEAYMNASNDLNFSKFVVGAPCCAVFQDGAWYRGKIKNILSNACDVFFVDYGNIDTVENSKIKRLRNDLFRFPIQALHCKFFNISPIGKDWNDDEINAFINMTLDKSFVAQFVEFDSKGVYAVNLVSIGKLEHDIFNKEFVNLGFGRLQDTKKSLILNAHAASTNLTFTLPKVKEGSIKGVEIAYGLNPCEIFCQLRSLASEFKEMMFNLQHYYSKVSETELLIDRPHAGMICVAKFHLDSAWYRAEIRKVEANKILVYFVDYGNFETVERKKVCCIIQDYAILPVQAIKCRIRGIKPSGKRLIFNNNLSHYFEGNAVCKFISKDKDYYLVDVTINGKDVAELLVADKLAILDGPVTGVKSAEEAIINNVPVATSKLSKYEELSLVFDPGELFAVTISYMESPSKFWCQLLDEREILDQLMLDIEAYCMNSAVTNDPTLLNVGCLCIVQYDVDKAWYRAKIKSCHPNNSYEIFFIDYGNSDVVTLSEIKPIPEEFTELPPRCFECCLQHTPQNTTDEMKSLFQEIIDEAYEITVLIEKVLPNNFIVTLLYDKEDQEVNVNEMLFGTREQVENVVKYIPRFLPPDVPLGLHDGYVSVVNTPQDFYIQLSHAEDILADLITELFNTCESSEEILSDLCVGYACCCKYSEDNNWYRAEIIALHECTVDVLFVDYGNVDTVEHSVLKRLSIKHLEMPPIAIKCKLNGIGPVTDGWTEEAINIFQQMVSDSCLGITFISKDVPAVVNITKDDKEIAHCLVDLELANVETCAETDEAYAEDHLAPPVEDALNSLPYDQSYPERKISSSKLAVKLCFIDNCNKFYVTPLELSTELDTVMTTLDLLYAEDKKESNSNIPDILEEPKVLMPCVAKYSEDNVWYRALITEINGDNIWVSFIDYGNMELTSMKNLRPITPELVKIPPIALECSLFGIEAISGQEEAITRKLDYYFVEEVELEMEIFESSPYKIKLNHDGDVATMLIQKGFAKDTIIETNTDETFVDSSKMESLEFKIQISKRYFTGVDKIVGSVKFCEVENDFITFHVVSSDLEEELNNLQHELQDAYSEPPQNLSVVSCSDFCVTKYMEDENWYRAQVLYCEKDKVKVRFIDYGNCETVDKTDIYELLPDFTAEPQFSVKCILFGVKVNKNKEVELQNTLDDYVYHDTVELKLCTFGHAASDPCITSVICGDIDLCDMIVNENLVSQQYVTNSQLDDNFKATIEKIESAIYYVFPLHLANERKDFQCKLQETCKDLNISPSDVSCYNLYAAKVDEKWHRVSVVETSSENIIVDLVDFGTTVTVLAFNLILLPAEFCHQPLFLQPCVFEESDKLNNEKLHLGTTVFCQVVKMQSIDQPVKVKVLEIDSFAENKINDAQRLTEEIVESYDNTTGKQELDNKKSLYVNAHYTKYGIIQNIAENKADFSECVAGDNEPFSEVKKFIAVSVSENMKDSEINIDDNLKDSEVDIDENVNDSEVNIDEYVKDSEVYIDEHVKYSEVNIDEIVKDSEIDIDENVKDSEVNIDENVKDSEVDIEENVKGSEVDIDENVNDSEVNIDEYVKDSEVYIDEHVKYSEVNIDEIVKDSEIDIDENVKDSEVNIDENMKDSEVDIEENVKGSEVNTDENVKDFEVDTDENVKNYKVDIDKNVNDSKVNIDENIKDPDVDIDENVKGSDEIVRDFEVDTDQNVENCEVDIDETVKDSEVNINKGFDKGKITELTINALNNDEDLENTVESNETKKTISKIRGSSAENLDKHDMYGIEKNKHIKECYGDELQMSYSNLVLNDKNDAENMAISDAVCDISDDSATHRFVDGEFFKNSNQPDEEKFDDNELNDLVKSVDIREIEKNFEAEDLPFEVVADDMHVVHSCDKIDAHVETSSIDHIKCIKEENSNENENTTDICNLPDSHFKDNKLEVNKNCTDSCNVLTGYKMSKNQVEQFHATNEKICDVDLIHVQPEDIEKKSVTESTSNNSLDFPSENAKIENLNLKDSENEYSNENDTKSFDIQHIDTQQESITKDTFGENNRTLPESYLLSGIVQIRVSDIAVSEDGSIIFAVQSLDHEETFLHLKSSMQNHYPMNSEFDNDAFETNFCAVLHDSEWCRGKILQKGGDSWTIMLIDYGKCISVSSSNIKALRDDHYIVPSYVVWCTLANVFCLPEKSEDVKSLLFPILKNADCVLKVLEGSEPYKIDLFINNSSILNQLLTNGLVSLKLPDMDIKPGSYKAKLSHLNVNSKRVSMFVNLSMLSEDFSILSKSMQNLYKIEDSISDIVESGLYSVYHNNLWSRAIVLSTANQTDVHLIDTGEDVTNCTSLCFLLLEHCLQPAFAITCHIPFANDHPEFIPESLDQIMSEREFLVNVEVCPHTDVVSATLIDDQIVTDLKQLGCRFGDINEFCISASEEKSKAGNSDPEVQCAIRAPNQESSEHIVSYIEETFITEPL